MTNSQKWSATSFGVFLLQIPALFWSVNTKLGTHMAGPRRIDPEIKRSGLHGYECAAGVGMHVDRTASA